MMMATSDAGQASRSGSQPSLTDHDPPALEMLPDYRPNWPLRIGLGIIALVAVLFILYMQLASGEKDGAGAAGQADTPPRETSAAAAPLREEPEPPPPPTPRALAEEWRDSVLAGTVFGDLPIRELSGRLHLVYEAQPGDSIAAIVGAYRRSTGQEDTPGLVEIARESHAEQYGRGLWPGDEVLLALPGAATRARSDVPATTGKKE